MTRAVFIAAFLLTLCAGTARAGEMKYIPDPVYQSFNPSDTSPMQDMIDLANGGDIRAQYILGDLYAKGKGGLSKDEKAGARWFEIAAKNGYYEAFIRLAALARRQDKPVDAYKWYTLAMHYMDYGPWRDYAETARDALEKNHKFTQTELDEARKDGNLWRAAQRRAAEEEEEREAVAAKQRKKELDAAQKKMGKMMGPPKPEPAPKTEVNEQKEMP
jgi:TPR repeat protein